MNNPSSKTKYNVVRSVVEGGVATLSIAVGLWLVYDFAKRYLGGEQVNCHKFNSGCIGSEILIGAFFLVAGVVGFLHLYIIFRQGENA